LGKVSGKEKRKTANSKRRDRDEKLVRPDRSNTRKKKETLQHTTSTTYPKKRERPL